MKVRNVEALGELLLTFDKMKYWAIIPHGGTMSPDVRHLSMVLTENGVGEQKHQWVTQRKQALAIFPLIVVPTAFDVPCMATTQGGRSYILQG